MDAEPPPSPPTHCTAALSFLKGCVLLSPPPPLLFLFLSLSRSRNFLQTPSLFYPPHPDGCSVRLLSGSFRLYISHTSPASSSASQFQNSPSNFTSVLVLWLSFVKVSILFRIYLYSFQFSPLFFSLTVLSLLLCLGAYFLWLLSLCLVAHKVIQFFSQHYYKLHSFLLPASFTDPRSLKTRGKSSSIFPCFFLKLTYDINLQSTLQGRHVCGLRGAFKKWKLNYSCVSSHICEAWRAKKKERKKKTVLL